MIRALSIEAVYSICIDIIEHLDRYIVGMNIKHKLFFLLYHFSFIFDTLTVSFVQEWIDEVFDFRSFLIIMFVWLEIDLSNWISYFLQQNIATLI